MDVLKALFPPRRDVGLGQESSPVWYRSRPVYWAVLYTIVFVALAGMIALTARDRPRFASNTIAQQAVVARVSFTAENKAATEEARADAYQREPAVYVPNTKYFSEIRERLNSLVKVASDPSIQTVDQIPESVRTSLEIKPDTLAELRRLLINGQPTPQWNVYVNDFFGDFENLAILSTTDASRELDPHQRAPKIAIQTPSKTEAIVYDNMIIPVNNVEELRSRVQRLADHSFPKPLRTTMVNLVTIHVLPTYLFDPEASKARAKLARDREPMVLREFHANDVLIPAGKLLNQDTDVNLIELENKAYLEKVRKLSPMLPLLNDVGQLGTVLLVSLMVWGYIFAYNPKISKNPLRGLAITALLVGAQGVAVAATSAFPRVVFLTAVFPTLLSAIVLAIAYERRFAMAIGAIHALLVMISLDLSAEFGLVLLVGIGVAVVQLNEVRTRSKLVVTGIWSGLAMGFTVMVASLATRTLILPDSLDSSLLEDQLRGILNDATIATLTGIIAGMLIQGILPPIEKMFKVTTALSLKELNEASLPLLRRLAEEAPGTYQHSLRIADMSEAAAQAIGADGLLCRVGAMYHDIGKINKPLYFVENQGDGLNRHNKLSPAMSLLIIVGHVKDGMEMAREYALPVPVRHFIEAHHGTTLVEYFYHAAKMQSDAQAKTPPSEFEFRYPGPKPQTREAAILMIADGVEGAARTLADPTPARLEGLVHFMAQKRLTDGQFDECGITLQELYKIEQAIAKTLAAMYHRRIAYPADQTKTPIADDAPASSAAAS